MGRQVERGLFGNDSGLQERSAERPANRRMGENNSQLGIQLTQANPDQAGKVTIEGLRAILIRQQYRCALSGVVLSPDCASLDHIVPLSKGGRHVLSNCQIVHPIVNRLKADMSQEEFVGWAKLIASAAMDEVDHEF